MWQAGWCGPSMWGFWWIFPVIGLAICLVFVMAMIRAMSRGSGFMCMGGHGHTREGTAELRAEVGKLREEVGRLRSTSA
jgi:hypothetical protein